jgi:hypothetical protein
MNIAARVALLLLLAVPAQAQGTSSTGEGLVVDTNLFCDTRQQVERFVALLSDNGRNAEAALTAVNNENRMTDACVIATAIYQRRDAVATVQTENVLFDVTRITVVGIFTIEGLEEATPTEFFTIIPREERSATVSQR